MCVDPNFTLFIAAFAMGSLFGIVLSIGTEESEDDDLY